MPDQPVSYLQNCCLHEPLNHRDQKASGKSATWCSSGAKQVKWTGNAALEASLHLRVVLAHEMARYPCPECFLTRK